MTAEQDLVAGLSSELESATTKLKEYDQYLEGEQALQYMAPALQDLIGDRVTQLVINLPRLATLAYESVLDVHGFRYPKRKNGDKLLWDIWQANDLDEQSQQAHIESIALSRSYVISGAGDAPGDAPIVTVESPFQVFARRSARTRKVTSAIKRYTEGAGDTKEEWATLYLPESTVHFIMRDGEWREDERDDHDLGVVPVVPLVNNPRILRPDGRSEFFDVIPIANAVNKMATDMMISAEFHAMPRRWVFGMDAKDFEDEDGNPISTWKQLAGGIWSSEKSAQDVQAGQFQEADLTNFHNSIKMLMQIGGQLLALPPYYVGFTGDNPASADAIRSSESQKNKRAERKQTYLGGAWEQVQRNNLLILGKLDKNAAGIETLWRNPATPTKAQEADASVKLVTLNIIPPEQAREDLGYSVEQRKRMEEWDQRARTDPFMAQMNRETNGDTPGDA